MHKNILVIIFSGKLDQTKTGCSGVLKSCYRLMNVVHDKSLTILYKKYYKVSLKKPLTTVSKKVVPLIVEEEALVSYHRKNRTVIKRLYLFIAKSKNTYLQSQGTSHTPP